jgi:hypothetical protein
MQEQLPTTAWMQEEQDRVKQSGGACHIRSGPEICSM